MLVKIMDELGIDTGIKVTLLKLQYDGEKLLIIGELQSSVHKLPTATLRPIVEIRYFDKDDELLGYTYSNYDGIDFSLGRCLFEINETCSDLSRCELRVTFKEGGKKP